MAMCDKVDCYALGCVFHELLAWRTPWEGKLDAVVYDACVVEAAEAADAAAVAVVAAGGGGGGGAEVARAQQQPPPPLDAPPPYLQAVRDALPPVAQRPPPTADELNAMSWPQLLRAVRAGAAPANGAGAGGSTP
ncbi:hypothetical protein KFE25_002580 [Diacronema lutheri]|uniref:Protein kinase domain-containing protein n=1 Tax=Diacronema lutheri TaxID=2081491 RepID=A0A8J5XE80_DIALT|nr:hypothetical protein KFE25_002580 [Diacronema lutheri]